MRTTLLPALLHLLPVASAWGTLGHTTVTLIATNLLLPKTLKFVQETLNSTSPIPMAAVATWADSYRYTAEGSYSSPLHYIDSMDDPPNGKCNVVFSRDCPADGCIVSAIANYTQRLTDKKLPAAQREIALKFVLHFLGDVHQPLHVENLAVGGNDIAVLWQNQTSNLHRVWDSGIPEKLIGGYALADSQRWAARLTNEIKTGKWKWESKLWLVGTSRFDAQFSALSWARDANQWNCRTVFKGGVDNIQGKELSGQYYENAVPVVEYMVAKAGYRLAAWLNLADRKSVV